MRRRDFIAAFAGAAAMPHAAYAQNRIPTVGFVRSTAATGFTHLEDGLRQGLKEAGFVQGQNIAIEYRYADGQVERLPAMIAELLRRPVAVIVANQIGALAAQAATKTVPIVFASGSDPVRNGLVSSLNRPGANITGTVFFGPDLVLKRLELLQLLVPKASALGMLVYPGNPLADMERSTVRAAAEAKGLQLHVIDVASDRDVDAAFDILVQNGARALLAGSSAFLNARRERLAALAARHKMPTMYQYREHTIQGGLMSYGASQADSYRQAGIYVGRILAGEKPADLPVIRSAKLEFVINLKTARELGLEIPDRMLALADEVVE